MLPCIARINWFLSLREVDHAFLTGCAAAMLPWQTHSTHTQLAGDNKKMAAINICILLRGDPGCRLAFTRALPTRRAFLTHPLRTRALARARCAWHAKTQVKRFTANSKSTCFALAHKLAAVTAMPQLKYVYFPGNLRVQCVCLLDRLRDPLPHAACTDCRCAQQCFLTWEASQNTMLSAVQQTATLVACSRSMSLAMASHCVMAFRFGTTVLCEFVVCGGVLHFVLAPLLVQAQLQVFHSFFSCAMLLCRGLLCALHFPCYCFCVYLYVFLQCSGFSLPTPTSPTSVREGCVYLLLCRLSLLSLEPCRNGRGETVCPNLFTSGGVCCPLFKV